MTELEAFARATRDLAGYLATGGIVGFPKRACVVALARAYVAHGSLSLGDIRLICDEYAKRHVERLKDQAAKGARA